METIENILDGITRTKYDSVKDLYVAISKDVFTDIMKLADNHPLDSMSYEIKTYTSKADSICVTILSMQVSSRDWKDSDDYMYVYRNLTASVKNVEGCIKKMADYCKDNMVVMV